MWGQPPSAVRRSRAPLFVGLQHLSNCARLDSRGGCPQVAHAASPHERDARAYIEMRRYNAVVPPSSKRPGKNAIYRLETGGILVIGVLIFLLTLARYWHHIAWGAR